MKLTKDIIEKSVKAQGFKWFDKGDYNLNIVGVRNMSSKKVTNLFDDWITISYMVQGKWFFHQFNATTEAGDDYFAKPMNPRGTAIIKEGQYPKVWALGLHQGKYKALRQVGKFDTYRDNNKDLIIDYINPAESYNDGINCHRANPNGVSVYVNNWSAACQVIASSSDFETLMKACEESEKLYGNSFTYTLLNTNLISK
jgi:hypothetical protein